MTAPNEMLALACPCCGADGDAISLGTFYRGYRSSHATAGANEKGTAVRCAKCEMRGPLKSWNTRSATAAPVEDAKGEPVAWRVRVRNGSHTYNEYTERLPFEPLVGSPVKVLGEPEPLYTHPEPSQSGEAEKMREALMDATANLVAAASAYQKYAARHRSVGRATADPMFTTRVADFEKAAKRAQSAIRALPLPSDDAAAPPRDIR